MAQAHSNRRTARNQGQGLGDGHDGPSPQECTFPFNILFYISLINPPAPNSCVYWRQFRSGYLGISDVTAIDPPNQVLQHLKKASQQSGEAETSNPDPKKRRREEMEPGGANVKRMTNKVAIPTHIYRLVVESWREFTVRRASKNLPAFTTFLLQPQRRQLQNKHVTIRPR